MAWLLRLGLFNVMEDEISLRNSGSSNFSFAFIHFLPFYINIYHSSKDKRENRIHNHRRPFLNFS